MVRLAEMGGRGAQRRAQEGDGEMGSNRVGIAESMNILTVAILLGSAHPTNHWFWWAELSHDVGDKTSAVNLNYGRNRYLEQPLMGCSVGNYGSKEN